MAWNQLYSYRKLYRRIQKNNFAYFWSCANFRLIRMQWSCIMFEHLLYCITITRAVRPLESFETQSSSDHIEFSGDFRLCLPEDDDEGCDVISGSGQVDATATPRSTDMDGDSATSSTTERRRLVYVERTSSQPKVTSDDGGHGPTSGESLVIVVDMTERSQSRHAGRPLNPTLSPSTAGRPPPYRIATTTTPASPGVVAVRDDGGSTVAERVAINMGLIVGIVGAVTTLVVMLAALLLCRPRPHVAQLSSSADVDDHKFKLSATSNGDHSVHGARHNIIVHATTVGLDNRPARFESAAARLSTANEWFV